ncbi:MAG TPA: hypothetical protein VFN59_00815 [Acidimicrobiales bacterium]|nr:hypothetical protein [Acidimicrobiales bacterium]
MGAADSARDAGVVIVLGWFVAAAVTASLITLGGFALAAGASAVAVTRLCREDRRRRADLDRVLDEVLGEAREPV